MTTAPVMTITEELLAELEEKAKVCAASKPATDRPSVAYAANAARFHAAANPSTTLALIAHIRSMEARLQADRWFSVDDRLPEPGVTVMVYSPPQPGDYPDDVRISFDGIDPDSDGDYWIAHGEHYEHYCAVAKGGDHSWSGPSQKAPYTHWRYVPDIPAIAQEGQSHG